MSGPTSSQSDIAIGMRVYLTHSEGIGGAIKNEADDFIVDEIPILPQQKEGGRYSICKVTVRNWETNRLIREISRRLHISRKRIGFAGTKDKKGITSQFMSFEDVDENALRSLDISDVDIQFIQRSGRKLNIGDLWGNRFSIRIRDCDYSGASLIDRAEAVVSELRANGGFANFFGVQRFGSIRPNTHIVGYRIAKRDFKGAVHAYAGNPSGNESEAVRHARTLFDEGGNPADILHSMPDVMVFEKMLIGHLSTHPDDYIGALRLLPSNLLMMFIHALQAKLFNDIISMRIEQHLPLNSAIEGDIVLPADARHLPDRDRLITVNPTNISAVNNQISIGNGFVSGLLFGYKSVFATGPHGIIEREVVRINGLNEEDFIVPEISECTSSGSRREILSPLTHVEISADGNSLLLKFDLVRGSYATSLLREIMK
ncbi:MAG: tRNA pseudouridine(13) synthase TruD [Candidatus Thermoplasmatota archaeon]|nr:tRNA pseudouridine(13) synthase TruD [Candidatus Sysuiplasma jiujiangense]MCL4317239.1 tRNA pseudouridine(13) synthase TruD [Candidatus Thermoplasmatota archaeon]MCL5253161.1 tRNA pseudouridine(13) synthase TruD [Candidatus Thermoplasmatota archaeon]